MPRLVQEFMQGDPGFPHCSNGPLPASGMGVAEASRSMLIQLLVPPAAPQMKTPTMPQAPTIFLSVM